MVSRCWMGLWSSYLNFAVTVVMCSRGPRMPTSIRAVGRFADSHWSMPGVGLEVGDLAAQQFGFVFWRVDDFCPAGELDGGVVAGRHAVFVRVADLGPPGARNVGVVVGKGYHGLRLVLHRRAVRL
jgi:hypothetical protein